MKNRKIYIMLLVAVVAVMGTQAQDKKELNKEITLEKDFEPVVKKAVKKNNLPQVKKADTGSKKTTLNYSDWTAPIEVPTTIPTMMPYGYRTAHIFSDKRGYFDVGGGTQANFAGSLGYRLIDTERTKFGIWLQHNSTWAGENSSKNIPDEVKRNEQKFNDNRLQLNLNHKFDAGTLAVGACLRVDNFNYFGGWNNLYGVTLAEDNVGALLKSGFGAWDWNADKQTFLHVGAEAGWEGSVTVADHAVDYHVGLVGEHSRYDKLLNVKGDGLRENLIHASLGGETALSEYTGAGLDVDFYYQKWFNQEEYAINPNYDLRNLSNATLSGSLLAVTPIANHSMWMFRLSPYFKWRNDMVALTAGLNIDLSHNDGATVRLSPNVRVDADIAPGFGLYANLEGGKTITRLEDMHTETRYWNPNSAFANPYTPFELEVGLNVGPFAGFSIRPFVGYMVEKHGNDSFIFDYLGLSGTWLGMTCNSLILDSRGVYAGVLLNYKYRSLFEGRVRLAYTPQDDDFDPSRSSYYKGAAVDNYGSDFVGEIDFKVYPIKPLAVNVGLDLHLDRGDFYQAAQMSVGVDGGLYMSPTGVYPLIDTGNIINLRAGASYRFDKMLTLWLEASNLLNKRWDMIYGMGGQRLNVMAGIALTF